MAPFLGGIFRSGRTTPTSARTHTPDPPTPQSTTHRAPPSSFKRSQPSPAPSGPAIPRANANGTPSTIKVRDYAMDTPTSTDPLEPPQPPPGRPLPPTPDGSPLKGHTRSTSLTSKTSIKVSHGVATSSSCRRAQTVVGRDDMLGSSCKRQSRCASLTVAYRTTVACATGSTRRIHPAPRPSAYRQRPDRALAFPSFRCGCSTTIIHHAKYRHAPAEATVHRKYRTSHVRPGHSFQDGADPSHAGSARRARQDPTHARVEASPGKAHTSHLQSDSTSLANACARSPIPPAPSLRLDDLDDLDRGLPRSGAAHRDGRI